MSSSEPASSVGNHNKGTNNKLLNQKRYCMVNPETALTDEMILSQIEAGSRVVDFGCGDGRLLERLRDQLNCSVMGVEVDESEVMQTVGRGVPVIQADLDAGLPEFPDNAFDWAVLSQTIQQVKRPKEVLQEVLRVARRLIVVIPNFGYWKVRLQILWGGCAPVTESLPFSWYNTPNVHFMSMSDFRYLTEGQLGLKIEKEYPFINGKAMERAWMPNLRAEVVMYVLESVQ